MMQQDWKTYYISQLTLLDERTEQWADKYFPSPGRERSQFLQFVDRYTSAVEGLIGQQEQAAGSFEAPFVLIGSTVTIEYVSDGSRESYTICLPEQMDIDCGHISFLSPLGRQLLLASPSDTVKVKAPDGELEVLIKSIDIHYIQDD